MSDTKNIVSIRSTPIPVFLRQLIEIEDDIETILVTCHRKSTDRTHTFHTQASNKELVWLVYCMQDEIHDVVNGNE